MLKEITIDEQENFSPEQINKFQEDEDFYRRFVKGIEKDSSGNFRLVGLLLCQVFRIRIQRADLFRPDDQRQPLATLGHPTSPCIYGPSPR